VNGTVEQGSEFSPAGITYRSHVLDEREQNLRSREEATEWREFHLRRRENNLATILALTFGIAFALGAIAGATWL